MSVVPEMKSLRNYIHCVHKKTPTNILFYISMNYLWI